VCCRAFVTCPPLPPRAQAPGLNALYTLPPQWASFDDRGPEGAALALRRAQVLVGWTDRLDELLVFLRRRLG